MSSSSRKKMFRRFGLGLVIAVTVLLVVAYFQRHTLAQSLLRDRLDDIEKRLGITVDVESLRLKSLSNVTMDSVSIRQGSDPRLKFDGVDVQLEELSFSLQAPRPTGVSVRHAEVYLRSGGNALGLLSDLRSLGDLRSRQGNKNKPTKSLGKRSLQRVEIQRLEVKDLDGWGDAHLENITLQNEVFSAVLVIERPITAACQLSGHLSDVQLDCQKPIRFGDIRYGFLTISAARMKTKPPQSIALKGVGVELSERIPSPIRSMFGGVKADLEVEKPENPLGVFPLSLTFVLPGGGRVQGQGQFGVLGGSLQASVKDLNFGNETAGVKGRLTGQYRLKASLLQKQVELDGTGLMEDLTIKHAALADDSIGPFSFKVGGKMVVKKQDDGFRVTLSGGSFGLGKIEGDFSGDFEKNAKTWRLLFDAQTPDFPFEDLAVSIPTNLLPHVDGIKGKGSLKGSMHLLINSIDFDKTELELECDTSKFRVTSLPPTLPFNSLRHRYTTRFEMPKNERDEVIIYERVLGPATERFVSLDDMSPLLPAAVMAQEDGGFRRHRGVSLFHLRGSLVDNLKKGRFVRGGSTVTMQLARNLFLNRRKTLSRKIEEIIVAWLLEKSFDKDELMVLYLNAVEFGPNIFGIREAAEHYFKRTPNDLSPPQVAWLIKLLPGPRLYYKQFERKKLNKGFMENLNWLMRYMVRKKLMPEEAYQPVTQTSLFETSNSTSESFGGSEGSDGSDGKSELP